MFPQIPGIYSYTNPDYLEANRRGEITPKQAQLLGPARAFLSRKTQQPSRLNGIVVILALLLFLILQLLGIELTTPLVLGIFGVVLVVVAIQFGTRLSKNRQQKRYLEEDLQRGDIRDAVGTLQFRGKTYTAQHPGGELYLPFGKGEELAPGVSYRFYYLANSGMILSAEPLGDLPPGAVQSGLTETLAGAIGFKLSSLPANQRGELTAEQVPELYSNMVAPLLFVLVPGGILYFQLKRAGYLESGTLVELISSLSGGMSTSMLVIVGILLAATLGGLVLLVLTLMDILGRSVRMVEGQGYRKISTTTDDDGSQTRRLYYIIGGVRFRAQQKGFTAFEDGRTYRAYYTPLRKVLVNLEVVE